MQAGLYPVDHCQRPWAKEFGIRDVGGAPNKAELGMVTVPTGGKFPSINTGDFVHLCMLGIVNDCIDSRLGNGIAWSEHHG